MATSQPEIWIEVRIDVEPLSGMKVEDAELIIQKVCKEIAKKEDLDRSEVSISIVDEETIQDLNMQFRGIDKPTDVLSFAFLDSDEPIVPDEEIPVTLGDIVISWVHVLNQSSDYGHSPERELAFLTAHGFYHLLGYDHATPEEETIMFLLQEEVLSSLGYHR